MKRPKLMDSILRIQARLRGVLVRKKVKSSNNVNKKFMPYHQPDSTYKLSSNQKIVSNINIGHENINFYTKIFII